MRLDTLPRFLHELTLLPPRSELNYHFTQSSSRSVEVSQSCLHSSPWWRHSVLDRELAHRCLTNQLPVARLTISICPQPLRTPASTLIASLQHRREVRVLCTNSVCCS